MLLSVTPFIAVALHFPSLAYGFSCGTISPSFQDLDVFPAATCTPGSNKNFTVQVHWNIFFDASKPGIANISDANIQQTMDVVNMYFPSQINLTFALNDTRRFPMSKKFVDKIDRGSANEATVKMNRQGGKADLNIYVTPGSNPNGWATFPGSVSNLQNDGIVVRATYLPGGTAAKGHTGKTLVHEIGHWLGLYHTFEGGCDPDPLGGDHIADTPAEKKAASGCPKNRDTCKGSAPAFMGDDPVNNFMDYTDDYCRTQFTAGQYERIKKDICRWRDIDVL